jgi:hypothetical protein
MIRLKNDFASYQKTNTLENEYEQCNSNANRLCQWNRHIGQ